MAASNPLLDIEFLKKLYSHHHREIFARVTALTFDERPIECIEGRITGGSVNVDGTSSMRRSCSLTMVAKDVDINDYYWGLNNKFKLEIGLKLPDAIKEYTYWDDDVNRYMSPYKNYPDIIWFPMGLYLFSNFNVTYTTGNYSISLQGKDKMCLLNGQVNGSFFASITFDNEEYYDMTNGNRTITKLPIKYIIREAVHEYAGEPFGNIMVNDLDDLGLELLKYVGVAPMYLFIDANTGEVIGTQMAPDVDEKMKVCNEKGDIFTVDQLSEDVNDPYNLDTRTQRQGYGNENYKPTILYSVDEDIVTGDITIGTQPFTIAKITYGQTCGYRTTDIIYAGDLVGNVGESLTSILDKIVQMLGEFEYFYDLDGHFVFQKKMNFIDHKFNPIVSSEAGSDDLYMEENTYVENQAYTSARSWVFDNNELITAFNNTPDILNIKNDFSLWGERKSVSGAALPIHMRYAIGKKPTYYKTYEGRVYLTEDEEQRIQAHNESIGMTTIVKTENYPGLSNEWWKVNEWAEYYALCTAIEDDKTLAQINQMRKTPEGEKAFKDTYYPKGQLKEYRRADADSLPTVAEIKAALGLAPYKTGGDTYHEQIVIIGGMCQGTSPLWDETTQTWSEGTYTDIEINGDIFGYHGSGCTHTYQWFLELPEGLTGYVYNPAVPSESLLEDITAAQSQINGTKIELSNNRVVCDWREIIYQMAKDYRKHNHEDDFYVQVRKNNGKDINDEWRYPNGITSYEPFYIDLEGFWRQLYCPPKLWQDKDTLKMTNVLIKDQDLYLAVANTTGDDYTKGRKLTLADLPRTSIVHAVRKMTFDPVLYAGQPETEDATKDKYYKTETIDKYLIINDKYDENKKTLILTFSDTTSYGDYAKSGWNQAVTSSPETLNFWFDMMDNGSDLANRYGIQTIGDRAKSVNDNSIKGIYFREVPTVIFTPNIQTQERKSGYVYMQTGTEASHDELFVISTQGKCAQDVLDEYLFKHTYCTEAVSITALPVYHLEPNTRIYIRDNNSKIDGEYIVSRITLPLAYNGTMTISAIKAVERIY